MQDSLYTHTIHTQSDRLDLAESYGTFSISRFHFFFFFFLCVNSNLTWVHCAEDKNHYSCIVYHCSRIVHALKNIKNGSHGTIHTFKNYFATVLSVFSFQFSVSATISSIQTDPENIPIISRALQYPEHACLCLQHYETPYAPNAPLKSFSNLTFYVAQLH